MHSPWGIEFSIIKETGWTRNYLLWGERWGNIQMMIADAPSYRRKKKGTPNKQFATAEEELEALENFLNE